MFYNSKPLRTISQPNGAGKFPMIQPRNWKADTHSTANNSQQQPAAERAPPLPTCTYRTPIAKNEKVRKKVNSFFTQLSPLRAQLRAWEVTKSKKKKKSCHFCFIQLTRMAQHNWPPIVLGFEIPFSSSPKFPQRLSSLSINKLHPTQNPHPHPTCCPNTKITWIVPCSLRSRYP